MGFFGKPKPGPAPRPTSTQPKVSTTTSPASTTLKTPSSAAASSPLTAASASTRQREGDVTPVKASVRRGSPLKQSMVLAESDGELTPPPSGPADQEEAMDVDEEEGGGVEQSPVVSVSLKGHCLLSDSDA